jgi:CheY-like chemotaxis protein
MPTILLVEDDEAFRYAASRHLRNDGYTVIDVAGSMDALKGWWWN